MSKANKLVIRSGKIRLNCLDISSTIIKLENVLVTDDIQAAQPAIANI